MEIILVLVGTVIGFLIGMTLNAHSKYSSKTIEENYIQKSVYTEVMQDNKRKATEINDLTSQLSTIKEKSSNFEQKLEDHKSEFNEIKARMSLEFNQISTKIFEENTNKFLALNEKNVSAILNPLKEKLLSFESKVDKNFLDETREKASLKKELEQIIQLNKQVSEDATKLTNALKGDKKLQGNWGEFQLDLILNKAGLEKDVHYFAQETYKTDDGKDQRPDFIINLPDSKNIIIDSKVSLVAYEKFFNDDDEIVKQKYLKEHVNAISKHITDLSSKNYQKLYEINAPDYVLLFIPIEPALFVAINDEPRLFEKALEKNIVLVTTSNLLATLRTIAYMWKQENQRKYVTEIANESGLLYDKFVGFLEDLTNLGKKIDGIKTDYSEAMNKLVDSKQKATTIIGRMERIKKLGANTTKNIPNQFLEE